MKNLTLLFVFLVALTAVAFGQTTVEDQNQTKIKGRVSIRTEDQTVKIEPITDTVNQRIPIYAPVKKRPARKPIGYQQKSTVVNKGYTGTVSGQSIDAEVEIDTDQVRKVVISTTQGQFEQLAQDNEDTRTDLENTKAYVVKNVNQLFANDAELDKKINGVNQYHTGWNNAQDQKLADLQQQINKKPGLGKTILVGTISGFGGGLLGGVVANKLGWGQPKTVVNNNQNNNNNRNGNWNRGGWNRGGSNNNGGNNNNQGCGPGTNYNCPTGPNNPVCTPTQYNNWCGNGNNNNNNNTGGPRRVYNCPVGTNCSYPVNTGTTPTYTGGGTNVNNTNYNNPIGYTNGGSSNNGNVFNNPNNNTGSSSGGNAPTRIIY